MYTCIYIYVYMYICIYIHVYMYIYTCGISRELLKVCQQKTENIIYFDFDFNFA